MSTCLRIFFKERLKEIVLRHQNFCIEYQRLVHSHYKTTNIHPTNPYSKTNNSKMSTSTPTPQDQGLPAPSLPSQLSQSSTTAATSDPNKPTILHLGDDIRWN